MFAPWNEGSAQKTHLNGQPRRHDEKLFGRLGEFSERRKCLFHAVSIDIDQRVIHVDDIIQIVVDRRGDDFLLQL